MNNNNNNNNSRSRNTNNNNNNNKINKSKLAKARRNRRVANAKKNTAVAVGPRSNSSVINKLASLSLSKQLSRASPYVMCRMYPHMGKGGVAIPDGGNANFLVTDAYAVDTITVSAAGTFIMQTLPCLPFTCMYAGNGMNITVNGNTLTAPGNLIPSSTAVGSAYMPGGLLQVYSPGVRAQATPYLDAYNTVSARIVALGYRIYYTGPVNTCAGTITVTSNDVSFEDFGPVTTVAQPPTAGLIGITSNSLTQTNSGFSTETSTPITIIDVRPTTTINRTSRTFRPEEGVVFVPHHKTNDFKIRDFKDAPSVCIANGPPLTASQGYALFPQNVGTGGAGSTVGLLMHDADWCAATICFNNINADASYRIETVCCLEVNPSATSAIASLTKSKSPLNMTEIHQAKLASEDMQIASSLQEAGRHPRG